MKHILEAAVGFYAFVAIGCAAAASEFQVITGDPNVTGSAQAGDSVPGLGSGTAVASLYSGTWQFVVLPTRWIVEHWPDPPPVSAYLVLRGPHPDDFGSDQPCSDPLRLFAGVATEDRKDEHLLVCLHFCAPTDRANRVYRDLWGDKTVLEGISAQILDDGRVDVLEHFRRRELLPIEAQRDVSVVEKFRYVGEVRVRHHRFAASDLAAATSSSDNSCRGRVFDPP